MTTAQTTGVDRTTEFIGVHPFPVRVLFGDDRLPAYLANESGGISGPGVQVLTPAAEEALTANRSVTRRAILDAVNHLQLDPRYLINLAGELPPEQYLEQVRSMAALSVGEDIPAEHLSVIVAIKESLDDAWAIGPTSIVSTAMSYLSQPGVKTASDYGTLIDHVNHILLNSGANPRMSGGGAPLAGIDDIAPEGIELWFVKEGSATIVFQVLVNLADGREPVRFVLNVAKDLTHAADELRWMHDSFAEFYRKDSGLVMEPFASGAVEVTDWRGTGVAATLAGEWFPGHELHVFKGSSQLYVWMDQNMEPDHPIEQDESDRIWEETVRIRALLTRKTPEGLLPVSTHINAGDYIVRPLDDGTWGMLLIWARRAVEPMPAEEIVVTAGLLPGAKVFGAANDVTEWWDRPERCLSALREGLAQAGFGEDEIMGMLRKTRDGVFREFADAPERLPYLASLCSGNVQELRDVFARANSVLEQFLDENDA